MLVAKWASLKWERWWKKAVRGRKAATWAGPWAERSGQLYEGLPKHLATALMLLHTKVLALNAWPAKEGCRASARTALADGRNGRSSTYSSDARGTRWQG